MTLMICIPALTERLYQSGGDRCPGATLSP